MPNAAWDLKTQLYEEDVLFLEWTADAAATRVEDGLDTFIFRDGLIRGARRLSATRCSTRADRNPQ